MRWYAAGFDAAGNLVMWGPHQSSDSSYSLNPFAAALLSGCFRYEHTKTVLPYNLQYCAGEHAVAFAYSTSLMHLMHLRVGLLLLETKNRLRTLKCLCNVSAALCSSSRVYCTNGACISEHLNSEHLNSVALPLLGLLKLMFR